MLNDEVGFEAHDAIPEPSEGAVATGIGLGAVAVTSDIDFDDAPS